MPSTVFKPSIKSRPLYSTLEARKGYKHFMLADAEGAEAILDLAEKVPADFFANVAIMYIPTETGATYVEKLEALNPVQFFQESSYPACLGRFRQIVSNSYMGLQIYLAGSESLIGQAKSEALAANVSRQSIQGEHRGPKTRAMQCVHCKGITENVTTDPFECSHCGLTLFVRDHFSNRLGIYQAVRVDAEDPGNIPEAVEIDQ